MYRSTKRSGVSRRILAIGAKSSGGPLWHSTSPKSKITARIFVGSPDNCPFRRSKSCLPASIKFTRGEHEPRARTAPDVRTRAKQKTLGGHRPEASFRYLFQDGQKLNRACNVICR